MYTLCHGQRPERVRLLGDVSQIEADGWMVLDDSTAEWGRLGRGRDAEGSGKPEFSRAARCPWGAPRRGRRGAEGRGVVQRRAGGGDALVSRQEVRAETGEGITHTRVALHCSTRPCTRPVAGGRGAAAVLMLKEHGGPRPRLHSHGCLVLISRPTCPEARHTPLDLSPPRGSTTAPRAASHSHGSDNTSCR